MTGQWAWRSAIAWCLLTIAAPAAEPWRLENMVGRDGEGRPIYRGRPVPAALANPYSDADEAAFQARLRHVIAAQAKQKVAAGSTYFENEKRTYGLLMAHVLAGDAQAIRNLQVEDAQHREWHRETSGIDFYACFTLKHQTRKYFYFGDLLEPAYKQRMFAGAKAWTAQDPLRRPHYAFQQPGPGWGPDQKNSWVDIRTTENLYLMRVTSVYLFAEETGNQAVAEHYKRELQRYVSALYRVGMGEWDSENYHGHSIAPLCNLHDFARDEQVRRLAKAALDWVFATGAVKYYRGGFNGPTKRDYNHAQPFGGSAANMLMLHFGDCPEKTGGWESDEVHLATSGYRPPPAVMQLARKNFPRPVELLASKASYTASTTANLKAPPEYLETHYLGRTFQLGSLASGSSIDGGDVNGCKLLMFSDRRGCDALQGAPGSDPRFVGSPQYEQGKSAGPNRVAQHGSVAIWLVKNGRAPWRWVLPDAVQVRQEGGIAFVAGEKTWIALRPLGTSAIVRDEDLTRAVAAGEKARFPGHQVLACQGESENFCGVALEVGEAPEFASFDQFRAQAITAEVDVSKLATGVVQYKSPTGRWLGFHWHDDPRQLGAWKNGRRHDWQAHAQWLYTTSPTSPHPAPLTSRWLAGTLTVQTTPQNFTCTVADNQQVEFQNERPTHPER